MPDVTVTMPTEEPESEDADYWIEIRVRDSRIDAGEYGIANEINLGILYISSQTNELRFRASERLTAGMEARYADVPLTNGLTIPSGWLWAEKSLWRTRLGRRMQSTPFGMWLLHNQHTRRTRKLNRVKGTR
jgi:hypothetical protein